MAGIHEVATSLPPTSWATVPTGYAGCIAWGDARLLVDLQNGDVIPNWPNPANVFPPSAQVMDYAHPERAPTYRAADLNGHPAVRFTAANLTGLVVPGASQLAQSGVANDGAVNFFTSGVAGITVVMVVQPVSLPPNVGDGISLLCYVAPRMLISLDHTGVWNVQARRQVEAWVVGTAAAAVGTPQLLHFAADYRNAVARLWVNGTLTATLNPLTSAGPTSVDSSASTTFGAFNDATDPYDGLLSYWGVWRRYYDKTALASLLPGVATEYGLAYA